MTLTILDARQYLPILGTPPWVIHTLPTLLNPSGHSKGRLTLCSHGNVLLGYYSLEIRILIGDCKQCIGWTISNAIHWEGTFLIREVESCEAIPFCLMAG